MEVTSLLNLILLAGENVLMLQSLARLNEKTGSTALALEGITTSTKIDTAKNEGTKDNQKRKTV